MGVCKGREHYAFNRVVQYPDIVHGWDVTHRFECKICDDCGHWLPLGPANHGGEFAAQVAVERRAAELNSNRVGGNGDFARWVVMAPSADESAGWDAHRFDGDPVANREHQHLSLRGWVASRLAGYLARVIATHDAKGGE
jgi:hypothetical protein